MPLAPDVGLAGLALGMQGVEVLLQPFLGRFAGVDGAANNRAATSASGTSNLAMVAASAPHDHAISSNGRRGSLLPAGTRPKNRGPDQ